MKLSFVIILFFAIVELAVAADFLPKSFVASLEQQDVMMSSKKGKIIKSAIDMKYLFPSNVYFNLKDDAVVYICNKDKTWIYTPPWDPSEKGELTIGDSSKHCYVKIFDALSKGLTSNNIYTTVKNKKIAKLSFKKDAQAQLGITIVELDFKSNISSTSTIENVDKMRIYKVGKKKPTTFVFKEINTKAKLKKSEFNFTPPKNTNIKKI
jgi:outer membrane lipoprotein-sorting protein